jgi:hypothetical protein
MASSTFSQLQLVIGEFCGSDGHFIMIPSPRLRSFFFLLLQQAGKQFNRAIQKKGEPFFLLLPKLRACLERVTGE